MSYRQLLLKMIIGTGVCFFFFGSAHAYNCAYQKDVKVTTCHMTLGELTMVHGIFAEFGKIEKQNNLVQSSAGTYLYFNYTGKKYVENAKKMTFFLTASWSKKETSVQCDFEKIVTGNCSIGGNLNAIKVTAYNVPQSFIDSFPISLQQEAIPKKKPGNHN